MGEEHSAACAADRVLDPPELLKTFPLSSLKLGSQSANGSLVSVHVEQKLKKLVFFVDNSPWSQVFPKSRSAHLLTMMINKSLQRQSPFANRSRMARLCQQLSALEDEEFHRTNPLQRPGAPRLLKSLTMKGNAAHKKIKWQTLSTIVRRLQAKKRALTKIRPPPSGLCGCVTFEVEWKSVHGILFQNFLQVDTVMALEVSQVMKREFDTIKQAQDWHSRLCLPQRSSLAQSKGLHQKEEGGARVMFDAHSPASQHVWAAGHTHEESIPDNDTQHCDGVTSPGMRLRKQSSVDWNEQYATPRGFLGLPSGQWERTAGQEAHDSPTVKQPRLDQHRSGDSTLCIGPALSERQAYTEAWLDTAETSTPTAGQEQVSWAGSRAEAAAILNLDEADLQELEDCLQKGGWHSDSSAAEQGEEEVEKRGDWWSTASVSSFKMKTIEETCGEREMQEEHDLAEDEEARILHRQLHHSCGRDSLVSRRHHPCEHCTGSLEPFKSQGASEGGQVLYGGDIVCTDEDWNNNGQSVSRGEAGTSPMQEAREDKMCTCAYSLSASESDGAASEVSWPEVFRAASSPAEAGTPWTYISLGSVEEVAGSSREHQGTGHAFRGEDRLLRCKVDSQVPESNELQEKMACNVTTSGVPDGTARPSDSHSALVFPELPPDDTPSSSAPWGKTSDWVAGSEEPQRGPTDSVVFNSTGGRVHHREKPRRHTAKHTADVLAEPDCSVYQNVLVHFQFSNLLLPGEIKQAVMADQRLLQLVEAGIPPWAILWQTMPGVCRIYRPWVRHVAMYAYVIISLVTALIGLYDLYKNVPVLRETLARLLEPVLRVLGSLDMSTRLRYLGTILFLQNYQRAFSYILPLFTALTQGVFWLSRSISPVISPLLTPVRAVLAATAAIGNFFTWAMSSITFALAGSIWGVLVGLVYSLQVVTQFLLEPCTATAAFLAVSINSCVTPLLQVLSVFLSNVTALLSQLWRALAPLLRALPATSKAVQQAHEPLITVAKTASSRAARAAASSARDAVFIPSAVRVLLQDLFSKVFKALGGIVRGVMAFIMPCIRHRTSLYRRVIQDCHRLRCGVHQRVITPARGAARGLKRRLQDSVAGSLLMDLSRLSSSSSLERQPRRLGSRKEARMQQPSPGKQGPPAAPGGMEQSAQERTMRARPMQLSRPTHIRSFSSTLRNRRVPAKTPRGRSRRALFQVETEAGAGGFCTPPSQENEATDQEIALKEEFLSPTALSVENSVVSCH